MALLRCENLSVGYDGKPVAEGLNFEVNQRDYLCIVGENGSGKSTLMKTLLGLISPISGNMIFGEGLDKHQIGYLPQQTVVQKDFPASVREIVASGCSRSLFLKPEYRAIIQLNMKRMNIEHLAKKCYRELSGGQQQRVLLARALCAAQRVLLLDEPVTGLDPKVTEEMYNLISELNRQGITIIMISHDIHSALKYSTHILHIGEKIYFTTTQQYKTLNLFNAGKGGEGDD